MAKVVIPILSDIHFEAGNPIIGRANAIAEAITSIDPGSSVFLIILPGDITWSASTQDYEMASSFLRALRARILDRKPSADILLVATPGNHDCLLPKGGVANRKSKVEAAIPKMTEVTPDEFFIRDVLEAQTNYWNFSQANTDSYVAGTMDRLCHVVPFRRSDFHIQINLLNSSVLSQHNEVKGGIHLPIEVAKARLMVSQDAKLAITVMHHWMGWIEPNNMIALRQILGGRSDIVITGHQHQSHLHTQQDEDGTNALMIECPALYDKSNTTASAFLVLIVDLEKSLIAQHSFKWKDKLYRASPSIGTPNWKPLLTNRRHGTSFSISSSYLKILSDPGVAYIHPEQTEIALSQLFVYPDLKLKDGGDGRLSAIVRGSRVASTIADTGLLILQGGPLCGKTALSKTLFLDLGAQHRKVVIRLDGKQLDDIGTDGFRALINKQLVVQYADPDVDEFYQMDKRGRAVLIDDWHLARLSELQRVAIYEWLVDFASPVVLFVDDLFQIKTIAGGKQKQGAELFEAKVTEASIVGLSNVSRGKLIANWQRLRRDSDLNPPEVSKEAKESEDIISHRLNKDSLLPFAFFILCMLQAAENKNIESTAGGSFGHLYEVLVTTALSKGRTGDSLFNKKLALLDEIAFYLWDKRVAILSKAQIDDIAEKYRLSKFVALPVADLLQELVDARVLAVSENSYRFAYEYFYLYFVARYIRNHIDDPAETKLRTMLDEMIDTISCSQHSTIVMFLIFFASERRHIIERLNENASAVYEEVVQARLEEDVRPFVLSERLLAAPAVEEDPDIAENRSKDRERKDAAQEIDDGKPRSLHLEKYGYSRDLSDIRKLHLAEKNIEVLGQVIRNFTTDLPGELKVKVIGTTYKLGLRALARILTIISSELDRGAELIDEGSGSSDEGKTRREAMIELKNFLLVIAKAVSIHFCKQVSTSVGVADMELAYSATLAKMDDSSAVKLVDITIKMEHSAKFPEAEVTDLYTSLNENSFAQSVCGWLIAGHLLMFKVERPIRQRMAKLLNLDSKKFDAAIARTSQFGG